MSPEQVSGESEIDGRSDVYSLGCVLYELLAGDPPYTASNPQGVLAKHAAAQVPSVRTVRSTVPEWLDRAVERALAKAPADRFGSAGEFEKALELESGYGIGRQRALKRWRTAAVGAAVVGVGALLWALATTAPGDGAGSEEGLDTTKYAVLPFQASGKLPATLAIEQRIYDALGRWAGIIIVDRIQVAEALARSSAGAALPSAAAAQLVARLGAGRYITGEVSPLGDSLRLRVVLYQTSTNRRIREHTARIAESLRDADSAIASLTDQLLMPPGTGTFSSISAGTFVLPALQEFVRAEAAILRWNLSQADSAFSAALTHDPSYAQAGLWLALVRAWSYAPAAAWRPTAEQALAAFQRLSARDRELAQALVAQGRGDYPAACSRWRRLTTTDAGGFVGWFGLATCLARDGIVLRDRGSPSGWRFRSSYHEAIQAYRRAFELLPSIHVGFRANGFLRLRGDMLYTTGRNLRQGRAQPPDTGLFHAYPEWVGDSLVFYPFPSDVIIRGATGRQEQHREGVLHQRRVFHQIAQSWAAYYPNSSDALEALALSMELLGDPTALDTLRRARSVASTEGEALRVAASEVWLRLKFALPDDLAALETVRALADSLLERADVSGAPDASILAGIAILSGRAAKAGMLGARAGTIGGTPEERALARNGTALWAYAAVGGPPDSLRVLDHRVAAAIESSVVAELRAGARREWLGRAASLVYPDVVLQGLAYGGADELLKAQASAAAGQFDDARAVFAKLREQRQGVLPERVTFDAIYPEARLMVFLGSPADAARWLDGPLGSLHRAAPQALADVFNAGALVRAMALRAELASQMGDRTTSARWAKAVRILWAGADPYLAPVLQRMAHLAN
jgi:serine/threonine-protein kinase